MEGPKATKKRRLADKSIPPSLASDAAFMEDSKMYQDLAEMERRLDWQMQRKKVEIQDTLSKPASMTRTLRLFLSHTVSGQRWQTGDTGGMDPGNVNLETGEGLPAWQFKLEGRLLELPNQRAKDRPTPRKLSSFIKKMFIELDRDRTLYPEGNMTEFHQTSNGPELDGFTLRRTGDVPVNLKIAIHLNQTPDVYRVAPPLNDILGVHEDTRQGVTQALWNYVKVNQLQDKTDRRAVRADAALRPLFPQETIPFQVLGDIVHRFLLPPEPIILNYTIDPAAPPPEKPQAWDVEFRTEDLAAKAKMTAVNVALTGEGASELAKLDEEITYHTQSLHNSHTKLAFLRAFASDPSGFIETWLASQSRDLDMVLGTSESAILGPGAGALGGGAVGSAGGEGGIGGTAPLPGQGRRVRTEELRRSEFFRLPWVEEAVAVQEGARLAQKGG